jgi:hypothetical protein
MGRHPILLSGQRLGEVIQVAWVWPRRGTRAQHGRWHLGCRTKTGCRPFSCGHESLCGWGATLAICEAVVPVVSRTGKEVRQTRAVEQLLWRHLQRTAARLRDELRCRRVEFLCLGSMHLVCLGCIYAALGIATRITLAEICRSLPDQRGQIQAGDARGLLTQLHLVVESRRRTAICLLLLFSDDSKATHQLSKAFTLDPSLVRRHFLADSKDCRI